MPKIVKKAPPKKPEPPKITGLDQKAVLFSLGASAKAAVLAVFSEEDDTICQGRIQSILGVANDLRIPKEEITFNINFKELDKANKAFVKLFEDEDWNDGDD